MEQILLLMMIFWVIPSSLRITAIYCSTFVRNRVAFIRLLYLGLIVWVLLLVSEVGVLEGLSWVTTFFIEGKEFYIDLVYGELNFSNIFSYIVSPIVMYSNADTIKEKIISDNRNLAGVYRWTNTLNPKSYVGSSVSLTTRFLQYFRYSYLNYTKSW